MKFADKLKKLRERERRMKERADARERSFINHKIRKLDKDKEILELILNARS